MKSKFLTIIFILLFHLSWGQGAMHKHEILDKLKNTKNDKDRIDLLLDLSYWCVVKSDLTAKDIDSSVYVMQEARNLSKKIKYKPGIIKSELIESTILFYKGEKKKSLYLASRTLISYKKSNNYTGQAESYIVLAQQFKTEGNDLIKKIKYYKKAEVLFEKAKNLYRQGATLKDLGDFLQLSGNFDESLFYLEKALKVYKVCGSKELQGVYVLISSRYMVSGDLNKSLKYGLLAEQTAEICRDYTMQLCQIEYQVSVVYYYMTNYEKALKHIDKALKIAYKYKENKQVELILRGKIFNSFYLGKTAEIPALLKEISEINTKSDYTTEEFYSFTYLRLKKFDEAFIHLKRCEKLSDGSVDQRIVILQGLIRYFLAKKKYSTCYKYLKECDSIIKIHNNEIHSTLYELYSFKVDSSLSKFKPAIKHYLKYISLKNSNIINIGDDVSKFEIQYETDKKNREIQLKKDNLILLQNETALQKSEIENSMLIFIATISGSLALLLLSGISYRGFRQKRQNNKMLRQQRNEIDNQNILLNQLVSTQNELIIEKEWLLSEVHDRVKNNLETIMNLLSAQLNFLGDRAAQVAVLDSSHRIRAMSLIHQKLQDTKDSTDIYMPDYINELVNHLIESYNSKNLICTKFSIDPITLVVTKAVPLGLILNELVTNAIKYAFIKNKENACISVSLSQTGKNEIIFVVSDNGSGFPEDFNTEQTTSFGIILIKGLTDDLDGEFKIENKNGAQFTIIFKNEYSDLNKDVV